ncbi:unnamed protein product [Phytophthora lilii]|uniref:Unnamed protein product n=1 Tax=Phytophthora lilii TaxID=2077276 RepID=A0A9W6WXM5_9STRA|nr:unnamed protein product [Phytophthora lilii]
MFGLCRVDIASYLAGLESRLERLRSDKEAYHVKCEHLQQELQQIRVDLDIIRDKIAEEEKATALFANKVLVSVNTNVVHEDAAESIAYYRGEMAELEELKGHLEAEIRELGEQEPVVRLVLIVKVMLVALTSAWHRMLHSKDLCYDRIHAAWVIRNHQLWNASAKIIAGLYHIRQAKLERYSLRQTHAARRILRLYRDVQAQITAKQSLQWRRVKRRAKDIANRKLCVLMQLTWSSWLWYVKKESQRRKLIAEREAAGLMRWQNGMAQWFLLAYRKRVLLRDRLEQIIMKKLDSEVLKHIRAAITVDDDDFSICSAQNISSSFLLLVRNDIWAWQVPDKHLYFLAQQYNLPLDVLPLKQIHSWLGDEAPNFVDLYAPLPTQTLVVLKQLSHYFSLYSRVKMQVRSVCEIYEAHMVTREYLAVMYTSNIVRLTPATSFSSEQRKRAIQLLQQKDRAEYVLTMKIDSNTQANQEVLRPKVLEVSRQCECCGHHQYEDNTIARDLRLVSQDASSKSTALDEVACYAVALRTMWANRNERCDFIVLHAFLHALAPVDHCNRELHSIDVLWKLAISSAYQPIAKLYEYFSISSLNELLNASREEMKSWTTSCCPQGVYTQLDRFISVLKDEWIQLNARLEIEAQLSATVFSRKIVNSKAKNFSAKAIRKRIMMKRHDQSNGRLEPLRTTSAIQQ